MDKRRKRVNGKKVSAAPVAENIFASIEWANGDRVELTLPMSLSMRTWQVNKNSVSVDYGPLTLSLKIAEKYVERRSRQLSMIQNGRRCWFPEMAYYENLSR